jgi:predicted Fe-S protein YdhL (DUF1289 family)
MDPSRGVCLGCYRTLDEIAAWGGMTDAERERVMSSLAERKRTQESGTDYVFPEKRGLFLI